MENKEEREPDSFLTGMTALLPCVAKRYLVGFSDGVLIVKTWGSSPGEGPLGLEFTSLCVWPGGAHWVTRAPHVSRKTLIKTASQAALKGRRLEERSECGRQQPRASSQPYCVLGFIVWKPGCCFSTLTRLLQL